jgi:hypothetical protein
VAAPAEYRTSRPLRRLLFALGSLLTLAMVLWGSAQALDRLSIEEEHVVSSYAGVTSIDLRHAHGDVALVPARGRRVVVTVDSRHGYLSGHDREDELSDGELRLRGSCDFLTLGTCEEDYRVEVPRGVAVSVRTSAGEATARGLRGDLDIVSNAGPVEASDVRGRDVELSSNAGPVDASDVRGHRIELRSNAGPVSAVDVRATSLELRSRAGGVDVQRSVARTVAARSSAGPVTLELLAPPLSVDAKSSAGGVEVTVPDVGYAVDAQTSAGEEDVQVRQLPNARRTIDVDSSAGNVSVKPLPRRRTSEPATSPGRDRAPARRARSRR